MGSITKLGKITFIVGRGSTFVYQLSRNFRKVEKAPLKYAIFVETRVCVRGEKDDDHHEDPYKICGASQNREKSHL